MRLIVRLNAAWNSMRLDFAPLQERDDKMSARLSQRMKLVAEAANHVARRVAALRADGHAGSSIKDYAKDGEVHVGLASVQETADSVRTDGSMAHLKDDLAAYAKRILALLAEVRAAKTKAAKQPADPEYAPPSGLFDLDELERQLVERSHEVAREFKTRLAWTFEAWHKEAEALVAEKFAAAQRVIVDDRATAIQRRLEPRLRIQRVNRAQVALEKLDKLVQDAHKSASPSGRSPLAASSKKTDARKEAAVLRAEIAKAAAELDEALSHIDEKWMHAQKDSDSKERRQMYKDYMDAVAAKESLHTSLKEADKAIDRLE